MTFVDTVNENVQESLIHKAVQQSCLVASGHAIIVEYPPNPNLSTPSQPSPYPGNLPNHDSSIDLA